MKAPSPGTSGSRMDNRVRDTVALLLLSLLVMGCQVAAQERKQAVFKVREVDFLYRSSVAIYSCSALRDRVATILRAVGARDNVEVRVSGCEEFIVPTEESVNTRQIPADRFRNQRPGREQLTDVRVRLMIPIEVTPQVLTELERDKSRRELVSRVTGNPAAMLDEPIVFWAQWQPVTLSRDSIGLEPAECELLDQMSTSVFPQLDVRVVRRGSSCNRNQVSRISPRLTVEALIGSAFAPGKAPQAPAAGESDTDPGAPAAVDSEPAEPATAPTPK